jgi:inhibitor of cysteine peptidase
VFFCEEIFSGILVILSIKINPMSFKKTIVLFLILFLLASCLGQDPVPLYETDMAPTIEIIATPEYLIEEADDLVVEELRAVFQGSNPAQVEISISGLLPDTCTSIERISAEPVNGEFVVKILTRRETNPDCIQETREFEDFLLFNAEGLSAGTYTISLNELSDSFTIEEAAETSKDERG